MRRIGIKSFLITAAIVLSIVSLKQYMNTTITFQYGMIPNEAMLEEFEKVTYTIPTIDEKGNRSTQTFTVENELINGQIVKLAIRNDKVRKHEFITKDDVPEKIRRNLPANMY